MCVLYKLVGIPWSITITIAVWTPDFISNGYPIDWKSGLPVAGNSTTLGRRAYVYLFKCHAIHHSQKGIKYNYNITLPLFDHIFGTAGSDFCIDNGEYCKRTEDTRCNQKQKHCFTDQDVNYGTY